VQALFPQDLVEKVVAGDPLAHEASLHIDEHAQDRVDVSGVNHLLEVLYGKRSGRLQGPLLFSSDSGR
jgi:hypothetical protein